MDHVRMFREEARLKPILSKYKNKLAQFWRVPLEFEAINLTQDDLRSGRFPIIKKPSFPSIIPTPPVYPGRQQGKVLKVNSFHSKFSAKLVDWEIEHYQGSPRWNNDNEAWDTVWLHFETMTNQGLPFHIPLRLAVQNGKTASVWQDALLEYGLVENVDFKFNHLRDMMILSTKGKDAIELVDPPEPMVIQFSAQVPVTVLVGKIEAYWDKWYDTKALYAHFRAEVGNFSAELI